MISTALRIRCRAWALRIFRWAALAACVSGAFLPLYAQSPEDANASLTEEQREFFEGKVRPLLERRCYECHRADLDEPEGGLAVDSREGLLEGGESGPAIEPGSPEKSLLLRAVRYADPLLQMPPEGKLPADEIETLAQWVRLGAPDPRRRSMEGRPARPRAIHDEARPWWAYQPMRDTSPPNVQDAGWPQNEIDRFVLAKLEAQGMRPAPAASRLALIRRATFDLTGLPAMPEEIDAFLADDSPDAFARLVDRLLASPHYGERWGRHWLDVVRYADTSGCNGDFPVANAFRYRNYVIESFCRDKSYDQFLREQIAGDLLDAATEEERYEQVIATGYLAISRRFSSVAEEFHLTLDDTVDNFGKAILGLTVSCARCHEHKFDPIPQEDYYALYGIFQSTTFAFPGTEIYRHTQNLTPLVPQSRLEGELRPALDRMAKLDADIFATYSTIAKLDTGDEKNKLRDHWKAMEKERDEIIKSLPEFPQTCGVCDGTPANARVHIKGDPEKLGSEAPRGFLQVLGGQRLPPEASGSGRRELAEWVVDPANPLTARVIVNRVWQHHFGHALVRTPDDFGVRGAPPTHPELLDWLALRFIEEGWSFKSLHRRLMLSQAYQMSCVESAEYLQRDPDNESLWTFNRRRLSAEEIRDAMLAVSGALDRSQGGPHPFKPEWEWRYSQHKPFVDDFPTRQRSVYLMQQRIRQQPFLAIFDGADTNAATGQRKVSATPQQALFMLNSELLHEQAGLLAERLAGEAPGVNERIELAYRLALGRPAGQADREDALDYLERIEGSLQAAGVAKKDLAQAAWSSYLRALLSSNEFLFVD